MACVKLERVLDLRGLRKPCVWHHTSMHSACTWMWVTCLRVAISRHT